MFSIHKNLARPYARAIFSYAIARNAAPKWLEILTILSSQFCDKKLVNIFSNPHYPKNALFNALQKIFQDSVFSKDTSEILVVIKVLFAKQKINFLPEIVNIYRTFLLQEEKCITVSVKTVHPLLSLQEQKLQNILEKRLQLKVILEPELDPKLIGGIKLCFNGKIIDGSVSGKLELLQKTFNF